MYEPRTREELARIIRGGIIARSDLSDTREGSVLSVLSESIGAMGASIERQIGLMRDAFDFRGASGADLDLRLSEFPDAFQPRFSASKASGDLTLTYDALVADLVIPAGSQFGRSAQSDQFYTVSEDTTLSVGTVVGIVPVSAEVGGIAGNCANREIDTIIDAPVLISACFNLAPFSSGGPEESDGQLKRRALAYLDSLARSQPTALEYLALNLIYANEKRVILADVFEDPNQLGYSELYIDDGSGRLGESFRAGRRYADSAPANLTRIYHDAPAVEPVGVEVDTGGGFAPLASALYTSIPERGEIYLEVGAINAGVSYRLAPYNVFTGPLAELQRAIEGDVSNPSEYAGWRSAGTRVRAMPALVSFVNFDVHLVVRAGFDFEAVVEQVESSINAQILDLRVGEPLYVARLYDIIMSVSGALNAHLYIAGGTNPLNDLYPPSNFVFRLGSMVISPIAEET